MKAVVSLLILVFGTVFSMQAQNEAIALDPFNSVTIGQKLEVVFEASDHEEITYEMFGIHPDELIIRQSGRDLEVYLEHARTLEKQKRTYDNGYKMKSDWYNNGYVKLHIKYKNLDKVILKGEEDIQFTGDLVADVFKLKAYGDMDITFENLQASKFKAKLYGENDIEFKDGAIGFQKYKLFGDNLIDAGNIVSEQVKSTTFGETAMMVQSETVRITVFGELDIDCKAGTNIRKGVVLGEYSVDSLR